MIRPNKNLVLAREELPAHFRPGNQLRLERANSANPSPSDPQSMLPGMGEVRMGNGSGSNGLVSGAADARMARNILAMRRGQAEKAAMIQGAGSPNGKSRPVMTVALARAMADMPGSPMQGVLEVDLSWAGNSLQSEQWEIRDGLQLRPIKAFGKKQTYVTTIFGNDANALRAALAAQPIVSVIDIRAYNPAPAAVPTAPRLVWEHVDTLERPNGMRWIITKTDTSPGVRYAVTLYRHRADSDDEVIRSDNLASEATARDYIKSYEVRQGDFGGAGKPVRTAYWNGIGRKGGDANLTSVMARRSREGFSVINDPGTRPNAEAAVPVNGLGVEAAAIPAWVIAAAAIGAFVLMSKNRLSGHT